VQHVNRAYGRSGTLFEGHFRSAPVEAYGYLLACQRYIELNPVPAQMDPAPGGYPWSSYRANAFGQVDAVVSPHPLYWALAETDEARRTACRTLFADILPDAVLTTIRDATNGGFALGNERFQRQVALMVDRRTWRRKSGRLKNR
jgi:putative transposase